MAKRPDRRESHPRRLIVFMVLVAGLVVAGGALIGLSAAYAQRFPPGTRIGTVPVAGLNYLEALDAVGKATDAFLVTGLTFVAGERRVPIAPSIDNADEATLDLYTIDPTASVEAASERILARGLIVRTLRTAQGLTVGWRVPLLTALDEAALKKTLEQTLGSDERRAVDATFTVDAKSGRLTVAAEHSGERFDYTGAIQAAFSRISALDARPITLLTVGEPPRVTAAEARALEPAVSVALGHAPLTVTAAEKSFTIDRAALAKALTAVRANGRVQLALSTEALAPVFGAIAKVTDVSVQEGRFSVEGDRVVAFAESRVGKELDRDATAAALALQLGSGERTMAAVVREVKPQFTADAAGTLGITELVAGGRTSFAGSPPNRRFNIGVGAQKLHGLLVQPGEEFSLLKALGPIDGKNGYRQELVIKGDRTIPEFGGGLCQIGTTFFRLVLNSGLPVLERRNHSYRVRYYEPPVGMDATIYEPKPDFRFRNDFASPLLLQARVEGDDLVFQFYGTRDGRVPVSSTPRVFNVKPPPPKKTIETTDLKPGETKCIEHAHPGSDAEFTYTVTYANGDVKQEVFKSHYRAWAEVCLVGVKKDAKKEE